MDLGHPRLLVLNFAECFRFYRDVMGFKVSWGNENDSYASFTLRDEQKIALALFRREEMAKVVGTADLPLDAVCQDRVVLIVEVEDVDDAFEQLRGHGVEFVVRPADYADWGMRAAYLRDPEGNLIELSGALDPSKWSASLHEAARHYGKV